MSDPNDPTPQATPAATPVQPEPASPATGTVTEPSGEATNTTEQAAPADDASTFTDVDANSLPPRERAAYDNMLRDYKKKTADIAEVRRKAEAFDLLQKQQSQAQRVTDEDYVRAFDSKENFQTFLQKAAEPIVNELKETKQELQTTKADLFLKSFKAKHSDFDDLDSDGLITGYVQLNPPRGEKEWDATVRDAYNYAKKLQSKWEDKGYKRGISRVSEKVAQSTDSGAGSPSQIYPGGDPLKITTKEAVELAMRGIRVPRSQ